MNLLERDAHLAALDSWLRDAAASRGRLVLVGGEAGVGKTTLVDHFRHLASGRARTLRGACDALSTPRPLGPLLDIAAEVGGELDRLLNEGASRDRVFRATLDQLSASLTPALIVIEDAHWADDATLDLLRFLGRRLADARALLIVTYRDDEISSAHPFRLVLGDLTTTRSVRRLTLDPLSLNGVQTLVRDHAARADVDPATLFRLTGGNPFFTTEVLADTTTTSGGIPVTVRDAVLARVARLPPAARETLDAASVIGPPIDTDVLSAVAERDAMASEACVARGMLVVSHGGVLAFRHELARRAVYDAISPTRRRGLHTRALTVLQSNSASERDLAPGQLHFSP